jgi:hypothetical protein
VNYSYRAYGLGFVSSLRFAALEPEVLHASNYDFRFEAGPEPDWVTFGTRLPGRILSHLPESHETADPSFALTEHGQAECYQLAYSDGTRFVVDGPASRIWGTFQSPLTVEDLVTYFLGPVMGFLLRLRHTTSLHASCVEISGQGIALCGDAGFGKSTTAAALALRGFPVLSEDIVPLKPARQGFLVVPGYPRICLWPDSVANLLGSAQALPLLTPVWEKRFLALDGARAQFSAEALPLGVIYMFAHRSFQESAPLVQAMSAREALLELVQNTYMNWLLDRERRAVEFEFLAQLVQRVPVRRIVPHSDPKKIADLCHLIVNDARAILRTIDSA